MFQQLLAAIVIAFFVLRLTSQWRKKEIGLTEFRLWILFWSAAALAVIFIKQLDRFVAYLGFSTSAINFLIYLAVLALFYLVFRLRLSLARLDKDLTDLSRQLALRQDDKK